LSSNQSGRSQIAFTRECIEFFAELGQVVGIPRSLAQIYGLLFASPSPLSFTDIVESLGMSKGSASQGLQLLRSLGAVQSVSTANDRRELFVPELGLRKLVKGVLREKIEPVVKSGGARLRQLQMAARKAPNLQTEEFSLERVKQIETWRRQMVLLLPLLKTLLGSGRG
jgi:HTH-type transcriptional regulator, glycine betaine synthesis regulator